MILLIKIEYSISNCLAGVLFGGVQVGVDVGENTTVGNSGVGHQLVEFVIVSDSQENVAGVDSVLLVILGGISSKLEHFGCEVLKNGGKVNWGTSTDSLGVPALFQISGDSSDGELKSSLVGSGD